MKNVTEDRGIKIDTKVLEMLEKAGSNAGSFRKLAKLCGISPVSISRWQGKVANQTVECIDWPNWEKLWGYLTKHDIIDPTDVRWMPPTVLRDALASGKVKPAPGSDVEPVPCKGFQKYLVVSTAAAAGVNTAYYPLAEFAAENPEEMVAFPAGSTPSGPAKKGCRTVPADDSLQALTGDAGITLSDFFANFIYLFG